MGGLAASIRSGVEAANTATAEAQVGLSHEAWIGNDGGFGKKQFATAALIHALVQLDPAITRDANGQEVKLLAIVTFLHPVPPNGAPGRDEPIDTRDRLTLPDGRTGPIVRLKAGMLDSGTGLPFVSQIGIGKG